MKRKAFIFDLDDTLADNGHRMHLMQSGNWPEYFAACPHDPPIEGVCAVARALHAQGYVVVYVTGRSDSVQTETLAWLSTHVCPGPLHMRKEGDFRPNSVVKLEILGAVRAEYEVLMVFDDQPAACKMWREAGLRCAQVAAGDQYMEYTRT